MAHQTSSTSPNRVERVIAYMIATTILLSVGCIAAILIGTAAGAGDDNGFSRGIWPIVIVAPLPGLIIGFLLMIALLVMTAVKRGRAAKDAGN